MIKAYFSEEPDKIKYMPYGNEFVDIWLRTNIEKIVDTDEEGNEVITWSAYENYFRAKSKNMLLKYVEDNFDSLLYFDGDVNVDTSLETRISDLEAAIAELIGGAL